MQSFANFKALCVSVRQNESVSSATLNITQLTPA